MKKEKFKLKNKKILSVKFITLLVVIVLLALSSTYAMFSERLSITGTVTGNITEFTYYFKKPSGWGNNIKAYYWQDSPRINPVGWPGAAMTWDSNVNAYKITINNTSANVHDRIIFNDGSNQTADLVIDPYFVNNRIYDPTGTYTVSGMQRLSFKNSSNWSDVYACFFNTASEYTNSWPGIKITNNVLTINTYYYEVTRGQYKYVVFNDGVSGGNATGDIFIPDGSDLIYNPSSTEYYWFPCTIADTSGSNKQRIYVSATWNAFSSTLTTRPLNAYAWNGSGNNGGWPGQTMARLDPNNPNSKVFWVDLNQAPGTYEHIIFNNKYSSTDSGGNQTADLDLTSESNMIWIKGWKANDLTSAGTWTKITMTAPTPSHSH